MTLTVRLQHKARLSGRVVHSDGSPARGVEIVAGGTSKEGGIWSAAAATGEGGSYAMDVPPDRSYLVAVYGPDRAARPIQGVAVGEGERREGLDFRLIEGTRLHGRVAKPGEEAAVVVRLLGAELPGGEPGTKHRELIGFAAKVDERGQYEARLGPGEYEIFVAGHRDRPTIRVDGTGEFVKDFLDEPTPRPEPKILTGVVVEAVPGGGERPVKAGVHARIVGSSAVYSARCDEAGRFSLRRPDADIGLYATTLDAVAAVKVAKGTDTVKVVLGPGATATGRVIDAAGRPLVEEGPWLMMTDGPGDVPTLVNYMRATGFEDGGRYRFPVLVPGAEYRVTFRRGPGRASRSRRFASRGPARSTWGSLSSPRRRSRPRRSRRRRPRRIRGRWSAGRSSTRQGSRWPGRRSGCSGGTSGTSRRRGRGPTAGSSCGRGSCRGR